MTKIWRLSVIPAALAILSGCGMMEHHEGGGMRGGVTLSGSNEVPAVSTSASGTAHVKVGADCSVSATVTVTGMTATASHIHQGAAGSNGGVIVPFTKTGENKFEAPAGAKFTEAQCAAYKKGETYVNVHSAAHPGGEVRGQLPGGGSGY